MSKPIECFGRWATGGNPTSHRPGGHPRRTVRAPAAALRTLPRAATVLKEIVMARPPGRSARPPLSVSPLEPREVPAGMIDVQFLFNTVSVTGDAHDNHARVDLDEALVTVTSDTGPIRFTRMVGADFVTTVEPGPVVFWGTDFTHTSNCQFAMGAG